MSYMAKIYYDLVKLGLWDIEDVPYLWKAEVEALLAKDKEQEEAEGN